MTAMAQEAQVAQEAMVADPRCGYPKKNGAPCRNRVAVDGKVCRVHQKAALLDRILQRDVVSSNSHRSGRGRQ